MRFMRLPILMVVIALATSVSPQFSFLLRFGGLALATLTVLGALSDMNGAARRASGMTRDDLLRLWFGKLRERHTWEALTAQVNTMANALRLPPPSRPALRAGPLADAGRPHSRSRWSLARPTLPAPSPLTNGHRATKKKASKQAIADAAVDQPAANAPRSSLAATLRLFGIEALTEAMVIATIALNWFRPAPQTAMGEQLALLAVGLLALGLLWFDWRLVRRFVAAVQRELIRLTPQASSKVTSSS